MIMHQMIVNNNKKIDNDNGIMKNSNDMRDELNF